MTEDLLETLLLTALDDESLGPNSIRRFAEALRARAAVILAERVQPVAERAAAFEKESAWRAGIVEGLEEENAWRRATQAALEKERAALAAEVDWLRQERTGLQKEKEALQAEWQAARLAHDRLLAHHRSLLASVVEALEPLPAALPWRYRRVRARIAEMAALLRTEVG